MDEETGGLRELAAPDLPDVDLEAGRGPSKTIALLAERPSALSRLGGGARPFTALPDETEDALKGGAIPRSR
jgi:hypothetical protein